MENNEERKYRQSLDLNMGERPIYVTYLEIAIIQAARRWHWAVESNNLYRDKQSRLQLKQMERSLKEACESYQQAILNELSRLGQDQ